MATNSCHDHLPGQFYRQDPVIVVTSALDLVVVLYAPSPDFCFLYRAGCQGQGSSGDVSEVHRRHPCSSALNPNATTRPPNSECSIFRKFDDSGTNCSLVPFLATNSYHDHLPGQFYRHDPVIVVTSAWDLVVVLARCQELEFCRQSELISRIAERK